MSLRLILTVSAALVATPVMAQTAPPAPPAPAAAPAPSPEEQAMEARGQAFQASMEAMGAELEAVMSDTTKDNATKTAETNAIIDQRVPEINAFAGELETFLRALADKPELAEQREQLLTAANTAPASLRAIPGQIRSGIAEGLTAAAAPAPVAPPAQ
jgi:hypothetical protein